MVLLVSGGSLLASGRNGGIQGVVGIVESCVTTVQTLHMSSESKTHTGTGLSTHTQGPTSPPTVLSTHHTGRTLTTGSTQRVLRGSRVRGGFGSEKSSVRETDDPCGKGGRWGLVKESASKVPGRVCGGGRNSKRTKEEGIRKGLRRKGWVICTRDRLNFGKDTTSYKPELNANSYRNRQHVFF